MTDQANPKTPVGPLHGIRIVEIAGIGPTQFCGMLLADLGAQILRLRRPSAADPGVDIPDGINLMNRGRPAIDVDLKSDRGRELVLRLCESADALFEGFRPGVMERLGLGPRECMVRNGRLVYGRMTGWGQDGPMANRAGHDTNYIALAGALHGIGHADRPPPLPLNLIGDFGGGAMYLVTGLLAALLEAGRSGEGQVVDAAMVDGTASMLTLFYGLMAGGLWTERRESNLLDGGAPFARCYETRDNRFVAVCALETEFFASLLEALSIDEIDSADQYDTEQWAKHHEIFATAFRSKTRDEWSILLSGVDACATPVLTLSEATEHEHARARGTYVDIDGIRQPGPAPRFSRTPAEARPAPPDNGETARGILSEWGLDEDEIRQLL
ncbi:MAG: CoA transferase [Gammaproteobacteria bacterium]|jgi:alpha-methylacyl-CoA racemase|nr:CoA transferase [Gammaproteobacteria bacterium]MDH3758006.1 CoA transferase [Gammaproteobacteria bacterium]MDH3846414.1 CoA transferase [Gammaproteobacteria bacterium]MDH3864765.1 CoA transferase [Gammaproteobacteria bacterium]MDH3907184.1 CoA transferase [Gammaproteobacteria bacterium]